MTIFLNDYKINITAITHGSEALDIILKMPLVWFQLVMQIILILTGKNIFS